MSKYTDNELGHAAESDGIEEYDNPLPDWWVGMFIGCIIWAGLYAGNYHFVEKTSQTQQYDAEVAEAKQRWPDLQKAATQDTSPATLKEGLEAFEKNCASCHTAALTGSIGPNLIDDRWIHGGEFEKVVKTISEGVGAKGMPAWGPILGPKSMSALASYILSKNEGEAGRAKNTAMGAYAEAALSAAGGGAGTTAAPAAPVAAPAAAAPVALAKLEPAVIEAGKTVFTERCVACHGADLKGGVGPNLTDAEWIHGGEQANIQKTIVEGVPAKGMITWKGVITDEQISAVAAYVYSVSHPK